LLFLRSSEVLVHDFLVDKHVVLSVKLVLESDILRLDDSQVVDDGTKSGVLGVGKTKSGFVVIAHG